MRSKKPKRKARMKRSPLKRGETPLKRRTPLQQKKPMARGKPLERVSPKESGVSPNRSKGIARSRSDAMSEAERRAAESWRRRTLSRCKKARGGGEVRLICPCCGKSQREIDVEAHHVIRKEALKKYVSALRLPAGEWQPVLASLLWDPRNGLPVCRWCHERHTKAVKRLPRVLLDRRHFQFAEEIGLAYMLAREYE